MRVFKNEEKIKEKDYFSFTKGMYYLLKGKISLVNALEIISGNYKENFKSRILKTKFQIEKGVSLQVAFRKITDNREFLEMIKIGEETGNLEIIFKNLSEKYEFNQKIKKEIRNLSVYPLAVMGTAFIIVIILLKLVVPKFVLIYSDIGQQLPGLTQLVVSLSEIVNKNGLLLLIVAGVVVFGANFIYKRNNYNIEKLLLKIKIVDKLYKDICILNFTRNMYMLSSANVPLLQSLKLTSNSKSLMLNAEVKKIIKKVEKGISIQQAFRNLYFFDREYVNFLSIGEKTGNVETAFSNLNTIYYEKVTEKVKLFLKLFEPLSIIVIGLIIGFVIFAVMLPMFKMGEMI